MNPPMMAPPGGPPPPDPAAGPQDPAGGPYGPDPSAGQAPPPPGPGGPPTGAPAFPSTDPSVLAHILGMLGQLRQGDHQQLAQQQDSVLMQLLQAMGVGGQGASGHAESNMPMNQDPNALPVG